MKRKSIYGDANEVYSRHYYYFVLMHDRAKAYQIEVGPEFKRDRDGFMNFVAYLGPVPDNMVTPTIGCKDHSLGYVFDNFEWQSKSDNSRESVCRNKPYACDEVKKSISRAHLGMKHTSASRSKISASVRLSLLSRKTREQ